MYRPEDDTARSSVATEGRYIRDIENEFYQHLTFALTRTGRVQKNGRARPGRVQLNDAVSTLWIGV